MDYRNIFIHRLNSYLMFFIILIISPKYYYSQSVASSSTDIYLKMKKLNVLGSVLYIAAHPDDENNTVLSYMSKEKFLRTGYLSLTRGDGGQNLIGSEKGDLLGVIRTQELLSARKIDGAEQYFTRAIDFGFSKTPEETLNNWDRDFILGDIVKVIRKFKPDIIITRFSKTQGGHGHHLVSAILAEEAFYASADQNKYPELLKDVNIWQAKRLVWDTFAPSANAIQLDLGLYNKIIGKSYNEIASESRTMHKTQGFGVSIARGKQIVQFDYIAGDSIKNSIFDGINLNWNKVPNSENIQKLIDKIIDEYEFEKPENSIHDLIDLYKTLEKKEDNYWAVVKKNEVKEIIKMCTGLWLESIVWQKGASPGQEIDVRSMILNRSDVKMNLNKISVSFAKSDTVINKTLDENIPLQIRYNLMIPNDASYTQPFWLQEKNNGKMFTISNSKQIGLAQNGPALSVKFEIEIEGYPFQYEMPVLYRWTDAVEGEKIRPFVIRPKVSVSVENPTYVFSDDKYREVKVHMQAKEKNQIGIISAVVQSNWKVEPDSYNYKLLDEGDIASFSFKVTPISNANDCELVFKAKNGSEEFTEEIIDIEYPHIESQTVLVNTRVKLVKLDIKVVEKRIGYIMGSGDDIPVALQQLGYKVNLLSDDDLDNKDLSEYDVIITGIRAFNVRENLDRQQKKILDFVEKGGTWVAQHNTRFGIQVPQIGPYPFPVAGRDRVAEENADVQILLPDHKIFNYPNKITKDDFNDWVQERGVNFADNWGGKLYPLLSCNDKNEPAKLGGLLYAKYGKGVFIYTAYSWFRQLPEGVEGAYRLFVNIISSSQK